MAPLGSGIWAIFDPFFGQYRKPADVPRARAIYNRGYPYPLFTSKLGAPHRTPARQNTPKMDQNQGLRTPRSGSQTPDSGPQGEADGRCTPKVCTRQWGAHTRGARAVATRVRTLTGTLPGGVVDMRTPHTRGGCVSTPHESVADTQREHA